MIKINLLAEKKKQVKAKRPSFKLEGLSGSRNVLLAGILVVGIAAAGGMWFFVQRDLNHWQEQIRKADAELERLKPIREKYNRYEKRKELLERKIALITELKKKQAVPVHMLDQISRNLPDFLWLNALSANNNRITITGKATTYNAVSSFYKNLTSSGYFADVTLGKTFEVPEGVSFSMSCKFAPEQDGGSPDAEQAEAAAVGVGG